MFRLPVENRRFGCGDMAGGRRRRLPFRPRSPRWHVMAGGWVWTAGFYLPEGSHRRQQIELPGAWLQIMVGWLVSRLRRRPSRDTWPDPLRRRPACGKPSTAAHAAPNIHPAPVNSTARRKDSGCHDRLCGGVVVRVGSTRWRQRVQRHRSSRDLRRPRLPAARGFGTRSGLG